MPRGVRGHLIQKCKTDLLKLDKWEKLVGNIDEWNYTPEAPDLAGMPQLPELLKDPLPEAQAAAKGSYHRVIMNHIEKQKTSLNEQVIEHEANIDVAPPVHKLPPDENVLTMQAFRVFQEQQNSITQGLLDQIQRLSAVPKPVAT